jgi:alkylation response protein AidB-like acyl-CoA dehydrogenase
MQFSFSEEEQLLCDTARDFACERFGSGVARAALAGAWSADLVWKEMAELGWLGVLVPEEQGGIGGSLVDASILIEELSHGLAPVPFAGNAVLAALALRWFAPRERARAQLAELVGGRLFSVVLSEELDWPPKRGRGIAWQWLPGATALALEGAELRAFPPEQVLPGTSQDLLQRSGFVEGIAAGTAGSESATRFLAHAHVAGAAALVGAMAGMLDLCVAYTAEREQFGRKIASFQAVRHFCAEMLVDLESSRSALYGAAWAVDHLELREAARLAAIAKAWCAAASRRVCEGAVQVHGGIGCTWESDVHLYLRLAHVESGAFGGRNAALDQIADLALGARARGADGPRG